MLRNRAQNCKKLLSIEFHTQLLSRDSQILFSAIPLAKGQISHDLHNFLNRINEIIFPSRQPFFFFPPPLLRDLISLRIWNHFLTDHKKFSLTERHSCKPLILLQSYSTVPTQHRMLSREGFSLFA